MLYDHLSAMAEICKKMRGGVISSAEEWIINNAWAMNNGFINEYKYPKLLKRGKMKECFKNATDIILRIDKKDRKPFDILYAEGFALPNGLIPVHHAWLRIRIDNKWFTFDPTWRDQEKTQYLGVTFTPDQLMSHSIESGYAGGLLLEPKYQDIGIYNRKIFDNTLIYTKESEYVNY